MTYSELLEIVLDARFCEGVETEFVDCNDCKVQKEIRTNAPERTCDGIAAVYKAKLRTIMKKLDEMGLEVTDNTIPAADVRSVVRGKWKPAGGSVFPMYACSQCRAISLGGNFCSNCGADMREVNDG